MTSQEEKHLVNHCLCKINAFLSNIYLAALLGKSSAYDFLQRARERRGLECFPGGCSTENSEAEELTDVNAGYVSTCKFHSCALHRYPLKQIFFDH